MKRMKHMKGSVSHAPASAQTDRIGSHAGALPRHAVPAALPRVRVLTVLAFERFYPKTSAALPARKKNISRKDAETQRREDTGAYEGLGLQRMN